MLRTRGSRRVPVLAAAVLGAASFLGGCASDNFGCWNPMGAATMFEVLSDGAAVTLDRTPERALAAVRSACGEEDGVLIRLEWTDTYATMVRIVAPGKQELAIELVKRIAKEAERR